MGKRMASQQFRAAFVGLSPGHQAVLTRVLEDLLREYERQSGGVLDLRVIDPEPFSEEEDLAQRHGPNEALGGDLVGDPTIQ